MTSKDHGHPHLVVYIETGDYVTAEAMSTIAHLGELICEEVIAADPRLIDISIPEFDEALAPLSKFFREIARRDASTRVTVMLDEFDSLPPELYRRTEVGDAFFQTIGTIAGKKSVGFILIGGENMQMILSTQGESLNKFKEFRVDYFDRAADWPDYVDLVRRPVQEWLEVADQAIVDLYELTAGNPFFTNLAAGQIARRMVERRDAHVTSIEVEEGVRAPVSKVGSPSFAHFWSDGIAGTGPEAEEVSLTRRKVLLGLSACLRDGGDVDGESIAERARRYGVPPDVCAEQLNQFVERGVLVYQGDRIACRVPLF